MLLATRNKKIAKRLNIERQLYRSAHISKSRSKQISFVPLPASAESSASSAVALLPQRTQRKDAEERRGLLERPTFFQRLNFLQTTSFRQVELPKHSGGNRAVWPPAFSD